MANIAPEREAVFATVNSATGEDLGQIFGCNGDDVDSTVSKAREAFDQGRWSKLHPSACEDVLIKL